MILGLSIANFTILHVVISLVGIAAGLNVVFAMLSSNRSSGWTAVFLLFTVLTSVTGFLFPFNGPTPAFIVGVTSMVILVIALYALYGKHLVGTWRWIYVVAAVLAQWFNSFVLVVQSFQKIGFLAVLAQTQSEPPFLAAQGAVLIFYVVTGFLAVRKFHPETAWFRGLTRPAIGRMTQAETPKGPVPDVGRHEKQCLPNRSLISPISAISSY